MLNSISARSDTVYVWSGDETIKQFTNNGVGLVLVSNVTGWNGPVGLVLDNAGNLYSGCPGNSSITQYATNGTGTRVGYVDSVSGMAFDSTGNLYATIPNYQEILKLDYTPGFGYYIGLSTNYSQSHLSLPISLAFDSAGHIFVANNVSPHPNPGPYINTIEEFSSGCTHLGTFATNVNQPWGLAFDKSGNLFVSSAGDNSIYKFTPGGVRSTFAQIGLSNPRGIAFDSAGNLFVANAGNGTIWRFAPNQSIGAAFATGLNSPTSIAIQPGLRLWATPTTLTNPEILPGGAFQFSFAYTVGTSFSALGSTNLLLPLSNWTVLGSVTEIWPGHFQFTDPQATNFGQRFYRLRSP